MSSHTPILFCLCGPSGVGKSTISRELLKADPKLILSVSATTRAPRGTEKEGTHYYFLSKAKFQEEITKSAFLEWAVYNEEHYGTPLSNYENAKVNSVDLLLDIDVQGAKQLKDRLGKVVKVIFVAPPSLESLRERLVNRGTDDADVVQRRLKRAEVEFEILSGPTLADHKVVNDGLEQAVEAVREIIAKERAV